MTISKPTEAKENSLSRDLVDAARYYLGGWRGLLAVAAILIVSGLVFNWSWLVAAGLAPILIALLPCAVMCGLGLCGMRMMAGSSESKSTQAERAEETTRESSAPVHLDASTDSSSARLSADRRDRNAVNASQNPKQIQQLDKRSDPHA